MLKILKNIIVGFLVSFVGSIPLGYLNVVGFEIYRKTDINELAYYLLGVVIIEAIVIYGTLEFAHRLHLNLKWKRWIMIFSVIFLLFLAYYFYTSNRDPVQDTSDYKGLLGYPPFITGLLLSCLNFVQIPFWISWNLYLVNGNYIYKGGNLTWIYLLGTILGTFFGMLVLVLGLAGVSNAGFIHQDTIVKSIPLLFVGLALFQVFQLVRDRKKGA
jgi:threonine/homoserine/homoserine lactone efflux protein